MTSLMHDIRDELDEGEIRGGFSHGNLQEERQLVHRLLLRAHRVWRKGKIILDSRECISHERITSFIAPFNIVAQPI